MVEAIQPAAAPAEKNKNFKKKSPKSNFTVSVADARHVKPLLEYIIEEQGWKMTLLPSQSQLEWQGRSTDSLDLF